MQGMVGLVHDDLPLSRHHDLLAAGRRPKLAPPTIGLAEVLCAAGPAALVLATVLDVDAGEGLPVDAVRAMHGATLERTARVERSSGSSEPPHER